jgi:hypothetical protein
MKELLVLFGVPFVPLLGVFIYAMITIAKDKKAAKSS